MDPQPLSGIGDNFKMTLLFTVTQTKLLILPNCHHEKLLLFNCTISLDLDVVNWTVEAEARAYN